MKRNLRTKKNRRYRKKNKSFKAELDAFKIGGDINNSQQDSASEDLTKKIEDAHSLSNFLPDFNLGDSKVMDKIVDLSEGLAVKTIDTTSELLNIDLTNSDQFRKRLEEIKIVLNNPKNKELMKEVVANFAQVGIVALDSAKPFIDDLIDEIFEKLKVVGSEFGEAGVKIALNTLEEIPGYGIIIGTIRSASNAAEAVLASSNAFSEVVTKTSDTINATVQNFDKLMKEKGDLINRTTESINKFSENIKSMPSNISAPTMPTMPKKPSFSNISGGSRKYKKYNNKSKKVRFNL